MHNWYHDWKTDIALRLCGAMSCGISYLAIRSLMAPRLAYGHLPEGALPFILAAIGFLCASAGLALLTLGHHLFDEVEISQRWQTKLPEDDGSAKADTLIGFAVGDDRHPADFANNRDNARAVDFFRRA